MAYSKLSFSSANDALFHFFHSNYWSADEIIFLNRLCFKNPERLWKLKMRLLFEENNDFIIASVFADANDEERTFLLDRFAKNFSFVKIGMILHLHPNALQRWRDKFLTEISALMNFVPFSKKRTEKSN